MDFDENFYKNRYIRLREVFDSLVESILGEDYYNYGSDVCSCDEFAGEDLARKCGRKFPEAYVKTLKAKSHINIMREKIEQLEIENNKLKNQAIISEEEES